jgi:hypothetical protein
MTSRIRYAFVWGSPFYGLTSGTATLLVQKLVFGYPPVNNIKYIILSYLIYMIGGFYWGYCIYPYWKKKRRKQTGDT